MSSRTRILLDWVMPLAILVTLTFYLRATTLDVDLERCFYDGGFVRGGDQPWQALYRFGVVPAWLVAVGSLVLMAASRWKSGLVRWRRVFLYLVLVMAIGPGLVVNTMFKDNWGRPRPRDLVEFGGACEHIVVWDRGDPERGQSFPSGHAATGFFFFALYFALRGRTKWAYVWLAFALGYGSLMGLARMIQGKHFLSDVVWSAGFVYLCAVSLFYTMRLDRRDAIEPSS